MSRVTKTSKTHAKRVTETLTISLEPSAAALLRQRAVRLHRGNVSAAIAEMVEDARISEAIAQLVESEGIAPPSAKAQARFDQQVAIARTPKKRTRAAWLARPLAT